MIYNQRLILFLAIPLIIGTLALFLTILILLAVPLLYPFLDPIFAVISHIIKYSTYAIMIPTTPHPLI